MLFCAFFSCKNSVTKKNDLQATNNILKPIQLKINTTTFLHATKAVDTLGNLKLIKGRYIIWRGNADISWNINLTEDEVFEVYITANITNAFNSKKLYLKIEDKEYPFTLASTKGPYKDGRNFQKIKLSNKIPLKKGVHKLTLSTKNSQNSDILLDFKCLEFLPKSSKNKIENEIVRAANVRESIDWMVDASYGVMFHWTSKSVQPDGSIKKFEEAVNDFDVEQFSNLVEETGAGYVIFTIGHAAPYCPAPIASWEKVHPGQTTKRDLIEEIANALHKKGIKLICYMHAPQTFELNTKQNPTQNEKEQFVVNFKNILSEVGLRYEDKIAGYWFDSWYQIMEEFPDVPFEAFNKATKIGYSKRVICLNSWIYPAVTPWQDYWAGEVNNIIDAPKNGYMINGPVPDLPYQALIIMEPYWVQKKAAMSAPKFTSDELSNYIKTCNANGGAVTINLGIYQNGTVGEKALEVMKEVKAKNR